MGDEGVRTYKDLRLLCCSPIGSKDSDERKKYYDYYVIKALSRHCRVIDIVSPQHLYAFWGPEGGGTRWKTKAGNDWSRVIQSVKRPYDFVFYTGRTDFTIKHKVPHGIYADICWKDYYKSRFFGEYFFGNKNRGLSNFEIGENKSIDKAVKNESSFYGSANKVFAWSEYERQCFINHHDISPSKIVSVGAGGLNLTLLPEVNRRPNENTILFVGTDFIRKGGAYVLRAFSRVKKKIPQAKLIIVSSVLKAQCQAQHFEQDGIIIRGASSKQQLGRLYRGASVFVMPSLYEAFGLVFTEAMAYKLPCIGTNICAMPEIIEGGKTGFLVPPGDADALAEKIIFLLKHKRTAQRMGERGRLRVEKYYNWDDVAIRILEKIKDLIS